jgi:hypothetical protein
MDGQDASFAPAASVAAPAGADAGDAGDDGGSCTHGCTDWQSTHLCAREAARGECEANPGWATTFCRRTCRACHLANSRLRCARATLNMSAAAAAWAPASDTRRVRSFEHMFRSLAARAGRFPGVGVAWLSRDPPVLRYAYHKEREERAGSGGQLVRVQLLREAP